MAERKTVFTATGEERSSSLLEMIYNKGQQEMLLAGVMLEVKSSIFLFSFNLFTTKKEKL